jgi:Tfp pilus assembly protein PilF
VIVAGKDHLQGWKDIAAYLARDERTVKRWEKQRGLPVRRIPGGGRANVYILVPEIDAWLAATKSSEQTPDTEETSALELFSQPARIYREERSSAESTDAVEEFAEVILEPALPHTSRTVPRLTSLLYPALALAVLGLASAAWIAHGSRPADHPPPRAADQIRSVPTAYKSPVPGVDELYLQGIYCFEKRTPASLEHARQTFEQIVATDPSDAPAYAALANTYLLLREYSTMPSNDAYAMARSAALRAIALDPSLSDAHASLAFIDFFSDWNAAAATKEFETAIRLDPNSALAHHWYGSMLSHEARYPEAIHQLNLAQRLEPSSPSILATKALALGLAGHRTEAAGMLQTLVSTDREAGSAHQALAILSLMSPKDIPGYLYESRRLAEYRNDRKGLAVMAAASDSFQHAGETAMWSTILAKETQLQPPGKVDDRMAAAEAALGQDEQAIRDLDRLVDQRDPYAIGMKSDPLLVPLHHNPKFEQVLAKAGLPPSPVR